MEVKKEEETDALKAVYEAVSENMGEAEIKDLEITFEPSIYLPEIILCDGKKLK